MNTQANLCMLSNACLAKQGPPQAIRTTFSGLWDLFIHVVTFKSSLGAEGHSLAWGGSVCSIAKRELYGVTYILIS